MLHSHRNCPLCNAQNASILAEMSARQIIESSPYYDQKSYARLSVEAEDGFTVVGCNACDFVFSANVPNNEFLTALYEPGDQAESIKLFARPDRASYAYDSLAKLLRAMSARQQHADNVIPNRALKILDVGCAFGVGSLGLCRSGYPYKVTGVEWSEETRVYLESQGMQCVKDVSELPTDEIYDGILLNDVLEHIPEPKAFLATLKKHCHKDTVMWINVPDFATWRLNNILQLVKQGANNVPTDFNPWEHLSYFTPATLDAMLFEIGAARTATPSVSYAIDRSSFMRMIKSLLRLARDLPKLKNQQYPNNSQTSGLYYFT